MEGKGLLVQLTQKAARYKYFVGFVMANKLEIKILWQLSKQTDWAVE